MKITVPKWDKEPDPDGGEPFDVIVNEEKEVAVGKGVAFEAYGRYLLWGEVLELYEDEPQCVRVKVDDEHIGWVLLGHIKDCVPHDQYVMNAVNAAMGAMAQDFFDGATADKVKELTMSDMINGAKI